jgi:predicted translin family RNA/ssDNA-binding protein
MFIPDRDEIQDAYNGFVQFRKQKDLYNTSLREYAVAPTFTREHDQSHGDYTTFEVTINGRTYLMGVPDEANPIFWIR